MTTDSKVRKQQPENQMITAPEQSAAEAAQNLERTLEHFESMLEALEGQVRDSAKAEVQTEQKANLELDEMKRTINDMFERMEGVLDRLSAQAERLSDGASDLATAAGSVEARMNEVTRAMREVLAPRPAVQATPTEAAPSEEPKQEAAPAPEPQFAAESMNVVLAAVPGFQGLMDAQRAISALEQAEGASVVAYKNGEASIDVALKSPVSARQVIDALGGGVIIEESRPDANKLRLRFVESGVTA